MALLKVTDVSKEYPGGVKVLDGLSFELGAGGTMAVTGPSGSGKTTLLNIIGALDAPTSGTIEFDGAQPAKLSPREVAAFRNREIGFVFQDHHLLPQLSAVENVLLPCLASGRASAGQVTRARELLDSIGLSERAAHFPDELSGGERQRVAIARAMIMDPRLVLCDEPTGNLDAGASQAVAELLLKLRSERGTAVIVVTHNEILAGRFERKARLAGGRLDE